MKAARLIRKSLTALIISLGAHPMAFADEPLHIGALFALSGTNAEIGQIFGRGADLAVERINADHMLKEKIVLHYEDSQGLPMQGVTGMNKLVNIYHTPYVLTAFTGVSKAIAPISRRNKVVVVNGGGVGPDLAQLGEYFWNVIPLANSEVSTLTRYLVNERKLRRLVLVYVDDPVGQSINAELAKDLKQAGGELAASLAVPQSLEQFSGVVAKVRDARPDAIFVASYNQQQAGIVKALRDNGVTQQVVSYSSFQNPSVNALPEAKGSLYTSQRLDWNANDPMTKRFVTDFKAKYNRLPSAYEANYYNAVMLFAQLAGELEKAGQPVTGENLLKQRQTHQSFNLVGGTVSFDKDGMIHSPMQINEIDGAGGKLVFPH